MMSDLLVISRANIFAIYPEIFEKLLAKEEQTRPKQGLTPWDFISLPTDSDYQNRIYFRLLTKQKNLNSMMSSMSVTTFMHIIHYTLYTICAPITSIIDIRIFYEKSH